LETNVAPAGPGVRRACGALFGGELTVEENRRTLLARVSDCGDTQAWNEFVGLYRLVFAHYAGGCGLSDRDAEDVAKVCTRELAAYVSSPDYDPDTGVFKRWLAALAQRSVRDTQRRCAGARDLSGEPGRPLPADAERAGQFEQVWNAEHLRYCLQRLRSEVELSTFEAFHRLAFEQWPVERVCQRYELTPQYVYAMKSRLTRRLRALMRDVVGEYKDQTVT